MYTKTKPGINFQSFLELVEPVNDFQSVTGKDYQVESIADNTIKFVRKSTGKVWRMDLYGVYRAYQELNDFKTASFKDYVPRTHSPALGLLLSIGLLK